MNILKTPQNVNGKSFMCIYNGFCVKLSGWMHGERNEPFPIQQKKKIQHLECELPTVFLYRRAENKPDNPYKGVDPYKIGTQLP